MNLLGIVLIVAYSCVSLGLVDGFLERLEKHDNRALVWAAAGILALVWPFVLLYCGALSLSRAMWEYQPNATSEWDKWVLTYNAMLTYKANNTN